MQAGKSEFMLGGEGREGTEPARKGGVHSREQFVWEPRGGQSFVIWRKERPSWQKLGRILGGEGLKGEQGSGGWL